MNRRRAPLCQRCVCAPYGPTDIDVRPSWLCAPPPAVSCSHEVGGLELKFVGAGFAHAYARLIAGGVKPSYVTAFSLSQVNRTAA